MVCGWSATMPMAGSTCDNDLRVWAQGLIDQISLLDSSRMVSKEMTLCVMVGVQLEYSETMQTQKADEVVVAKLSNLHPNAASSSWPDEARKAPAPTDRMRLTVSAKFAPSDFLST